MSIQTPLGEVTKIGLNDHIPGGERKLTLNQGKRIKAYLNSLIGEWSIVAFETGKLDGSGYGNNFSDNYGPETGELFIIRPNQFVYTHIGLVAKVSLNADIRNGWRKLTLNEGKQIKNELNQLLGEWSIVAFETGKLDGSGYGNHFSDNYGPQTGELFVIAN